MRQNNKPVATKIFKWLMVLILPLFSITATSCGDDDNDNDTNELGKPEDEFSIIGIWQCVEDEDEGFAFYTDGKVVAKDKGNYYTTFYKFSQPEGKLWIYMFGEEGITTYPLENMENWNEYKIFDITADSFKLSYELYDEIVTETYKRVN